MPAAGGVVGSAAPESRNEWCPAILETTSEALVASRSVAPDARTLQNLTRTSADVRRLPIASSVTTRAVMITSLR
jgi:hypothetical protein